MWSSLMTYKANSRPNPLDLTDLMLKTVKKSNNENEVPKIYVV